MIVIGIDVGLTGAIAFIEDAGVDIVDMPVKALPGDGLIGNEIDALQLCIEIQKRCTGKAVAAFVEQQRVSRAFDNAIQIQGSLMLSLGAVKAVLAVLRVPTQMVDPQHWKKFYGLKKDKDDSRETARRLYPCAANMLKLAKDHNKAESLLIAHYGKSRT